jgi:hypothetical protein
MRERYRCRPSTRAPGNRQDVTVAVAAPAYFGGVGGDSPSM